MDRDARRKRDHELVSRAEPLTVLRVGLTGGIASGKTIVAEMFAALGAPLVDTDRIAREIVAAGEPALAAIREAFGDTVIMTDGSLDRRKLRAIVFADDAQRHRLEAITHPAIRRVALERLDALEADYAVVAVPLLVETGFARLVDRVAVVDCPEETQLQRLVARDRVTAAEARAVLDAQTDRASRLAVADDVIDNGGDLERTRLQVVALDERYRNLARRPQG
jgi:dephospho-CoA kinase